MLPMYQAEAMWLSFSGNHVEGREAAYPFALKIATGKINAVSGEPWRVGLHRKPQEYVVIPKQPWLDGYCVEKGIIRQFVAMPLGQGYTTEEQITGEAEYGGLQLMAIPMKRRVFEERFPLCPPRLPSGIRFSALRLDRFCDMCLCRESTEMGLAPGGRMRQEIFDDPFKLEDWDMAHACRCFIHICNSEAWVKITGVPPPTQPPTAESYTKAGMPWFDYYSESPAVAGSKKLAGLKSVAAMGAKKRRKPLPENETVKVDRVIHLRDGRKSGQVREGSNWG
jgi:hypothetical protein